MDGWWGPLFETLVMSRGVKRTSQLQQHQRQPQREQHAHDDDGDEAHRAEGLALEPDRESERKPTVTMRGKAHPQSVEGDLHPAVTVNVFPY